MSSRTRGGRLTAVIITLFCGAGFVASAVAQTAPVAQPKLQLSTQRQLQILKPARIPPIRITAEIPPPPPEMQVFRLAPTGAPVKFLDGKLKAAGLPGLEREKNGYVLRRSVAGDREGGLRAFINLKSGDTEFIPNMGELVRTAEKAKPVSSDRVAAEAKAIYADPQFIPRDATRLRLAGLVPVMGGEAGRPERGGATKGRSPLGVMTLVPAVRYADGLRVYGIGSHAVVTFDADGTMVGAVRRWRTASPGERIKPEITAEQVRNDILRQLRPLVTTPGTTATVDKIELAYYDNNKAYLEPVYHFEATVQTLDKDISPIRLSGFIPIGKLREPIPDLAAKPEGPTPAAARVPNATLPRGGIGKPPTSDDITLGEYANRDWPNDSGYVSMSNNFYAGLTFLNSIFPGILPPVTRTQWVEAWPWEIVGPWSRYYMNAVNVAYTVPHGNWLVNTTLRNNTDFWNVANIGTGGNPGYGSAAGGVLATWIIMSCEVLPSYYDRLNEAGGSGNGYDAFNAWWPVFQGLHNVIAFRTVMFYPDNSLQWGFGYAASLGGDISATWFQEVAAYEGGVGTYANGHLIGSPQSHYDRASSMIDARDLGQSIYAVGAQSASSTLWNFWMGD